MFTFGVLSSWYGAWRSLTSALIAGPKHTTVPISRRHAITTRRVSPTRRVQTSGPTSDPGSTSVATNSHTGRCYCGGFAVILGLLDHGSTDGRVVGAWFRPLRASPTVLRGISSVVWYHERARLLREGGLPGSCALPAREPQVLRGPVRHRLSAQVQPGAAPTPLLASRGCWLSRGPHVRMLLLACVVSARRPSRRQWLSSTASTARTTRRRRASSRSTVVTTPGSLPAFRCLRASRARCLH